MPASRASLARRTDPSWLNWNVISGSKPPIPLPKMTILGMVEASSSVASVKPRRYSQSWNSSDELGASLKCEGHRVRSLAQALEPDLAPENQIALRTKAKIFAGRCRPLEDDA